MHTPKRTASSRESASRNAQLVAPDEKRYGGADSAAFSCNFDVNAREVEDQPSLRTGTPVKLKKLQ